MDGDFHVLSSELERRYMNGDCSGKTCDIADWVSYFIWDLLGDMTWSSRMGFMESGKDVGGMIATAESVMRYFSVVRVASASTIRNTAPLTYTGWPDTFAGQAPRKESVHGQALQV
jgi:hypothetical protein